MVRISSGATQFFFKTTVYGILDATKTELCRSIVAPDLFETQELAEAWCKIKGLPTTNIVPIKVMGSNERQ